MILVSFKKVSGSRDELEDGARLAFPAYISQEYIDDVARRRNDAAATEGLGALILLSRLATRIGADTERLELCRNENGRPYFEGSELDFSISHSRGIVAVAISDTCKVGIDVEAADMSSERVRKLADRYLSPSEASSLSSTEDFLRLWTQREAYVKQSGTPLAEALANGIPSDVKLYELNVFDSPATLCFSGNEEIRLLMDL